MAGLSTLVVTDLGRMGYRQAWEKQKQAVADRKAGVIDDTLFLVEHPHVITLGRNAHDQHVLAVPPGVEVVQTNRGGDVTYHGPGQLVGYPVFDLAAMDRRDVARFLRDLEESLIVALEPWALRGHRIPGLTGVWAGDPPAKIAALGVHLSRWVTCHGFALNVATDLEFFQAIVPCGIRGRGVTSMERMLGAPVSFGAVKKSVTRAFLRVFFSS